MERTVLSDDDLTHLFQPRDEQLVSHNQHVADELNVGRFCSDKKTSSKKNIMTKPNLASINRSKCGLS